ncbi:MAG: hypothetical protein KNN13_06410 [Hydrogenobacter thermophilus]|uniref:Uncharacterized protein n=1 Tax=Hydrogenobacter thermophilus (strain DSM 6534 / IAM 12695 / TK-6) TaxID=608538 RepID=D3DJS9_HYDTT|nr:hypothetical protein [Hydrogenobacter thermophilus]QWK19137.1 MAG: hypothetical protein KNN13_06410 [Hydrogenobacter thermophilus]BAI70081.1 hypothetical protein HTH_1634 [Hydrogenobacter thermophilus TK-6]
MDWLKTFEPLLSDPLIQFFLWMAFFQVIAQVFLDRRVAFWIASVSSTFFWVSKYEVITPLKAWSIIFSVFLIYLFLKSLFHFNIFLYLKGKRRCPMCYSEVHWKAKVCPYCHHKFKEKEV